MPPLSLCHATMGGEIEMVEMGGEIKSDKSDTEYVQIKGDSQIFQLCSQHLLLENADSVLLVFEHSIHPLDIYDVG